MSKSLFWVNGPDMASWTPAITIDIVKQADSFRNIADPYNGRYSGALGPKGFPTGDHAILCIDGDYDCGGTYTIRGEGRVESIKTSVGNVIATLTQNGDAFAGTLVIPKGTRGITLLVKGSARSYEILRPGYTSAAAIFTRECIEFHKHFGGIRPLDTCKVNQTLETREADVITSWASRSLLADPIWTGKGLPWEAIIALCNAAGCGLWLGVPHRLPDEDYPKLAELCAGQLTGGPCLPSYSNETWMVDREWGFRQGVWNADRAKEERKTNPLLKGKWDSEQDWSVSRHTQQSVKIASAFLAAFQGDRNRCRPILDSQRVNAQILRMAFAYLDNAGIKASNVFYGVCTDGYCDWPDDVKKGERRVTLDQAFELIDYTALDHADLVAQQKLAADRGLKFLGYEVGPNFGNDAAVPIKVTMQSDPRMGDVVRKIVQTWRARGRNVLCWFYGYGRWIDNRACFALTDDPGKLTGPKVAAAIDEAGKFLDESAPTPSPTPPAPPVPTPSPAPAPAPTLPTVFTDITPGQEFTIIRYPDAREVVLKPVKSQ